VIAGIVHGGLAAFEPREAPRDERHAMRVDLVMHVPKSEPVACEEVAQHPLIGTEHVDRVVPRDREGREPARLACRRPHHQRWIERDRRETVGRYAYGPVVGGARDDGHTGREPREGGAKIPRVVGIGRKDHVQVTGMGSHRRTSAPRPAV